MKRAGCRMMLFGIESADEGILKTIGKGITPDVMRRGAKIATDAGLEVFSGTNDGGLFSLIKGFEGYGFDENNSEILLEKLKGAKKRLKWLYDKNKKVKKDLKGFNVIHRGDKGINVVVKYCCEEEKQKILKYCNKHDYQYTLCPRYIRVKDEAISIEIKRLEKN